MILNKEQFKSKWLKNKDLKSYILRDNIENKGSITERLIDTKENTSLINNSEDKRYLNIKADKPITKEQLTKDFILDAVHARASDILDIDYNQLLTHAMKLLPQRQEVDNKTEVRFTFCDLVKTIEAEGRTVKDEETPPPPHQTASGIRD